MGSIIIDDNLISIMKRLEAQLSRKRYFHSIGVMYTCASLAMRYDIDIKSAEIAGLLHDCAKGLSKEELIEEAEKNLDNITELEKSNPDLLHAKVGKYLAKKEYGIEDKEILNAIFYHTTGKPEMTMLEKIVFVSDYIEPHRIEDIPHINEIRKMAFCDIDKCIVMICDNSLGYLKMKNAIIDELTQETYNFYYNLKKDEN